MEQKMRKEKIMLLFVCFLKNLHLEDNKEIMIYYHFYSQNKNIINGILPNIFT